MDTALFAVFNAFSYCIFMCGNVFLHTQINALFLIIVGDFWISGDIFIAHLHHTRASREYLYG